MGILAIDFSGNTGEGSGCLEDIILGVNPFLRGTSFSYGGPDHPPATSKLQLTVPGRRPGG